MQIIFNIYTDCAIVPHVFDAFHNLMLYALFYQFHKNIYVPTTYTLTIYYYHYEHRSNKQTADSGSAIQPKQNNNTSE